MKQKNIYSFVAIWILTQTIVTSKVIQKRQLYREQVSPQVGGKIPDSAFHTDRLALNQLQKVGIAIPDGVILEQRNPEVYQYAHKAKRPVYKVAGAKDHKYTVNEGRYKTTASFETTYTIPQIGHLKQNDLINVVRPTKKQFTLPNVYNKGHHLRAINNAHQSIDGAPVETFYHYWPYENHHNLDLDLAYQPTFYDIFHRENYIGTNIFNEFASFFDSYTHY